MKTITLLLILLLSSISFAQVGIGTITPDNSAALDVESTSKGFLPPRMTEADRNAITTPATGLIIWCTNCGSDGEVQVFNGTIWTNLIGGAAAKGPPQVGDFRDGGVVFYVAPTLTDLNGDGTLDNGLVCAVSDQSSNAKWGCYGIYINGATGIDIGDGAKNTIDIENGCSTSGIAADICANLSLNGFNDWFLPSKDELNEMYQNKASIDATAVANGGGSFASTYYWSSTDYTNSYAWLQNFYTNSQQYSNKNYTIRVRAVRAF